jgi:hypothetical protein
MAYNGHGGGFRANIMPPSSGGLATCGNAHGKLVDALADRVSRQGAGSVVVGLGMIDSHDQTYTVMINPDVRAVPPAVSRARVSHHETIRSEQQST